MNKKILVISNDALNKSNSNGRTLMYILKGVPRECLAQFYIHGNPDSSVCGSYYQNSDADSLNAFLHRHKQHKASEDYHVSKYKGTRKNLRNYYLRNLVWQSYSWWNDKFKNFLNAFQPDVVLLQAGDAPFMYAIARRVAKICHSKLILFNTESYVLKKKLYSSSSEKDIWHFLLKSSLKRQYRLAMKSVSFCIYNIDELENAYQKVYPHPGKSCTLYPISELKPLVSNETTIFTLLYCGNMGVGRVKPLDEIAKVLYEIDPTARIDLYGIFTDDESKQFLCSNSNVFYHGFVDYSMIPSLMINASMLIHCENSDRLENLKYAFSTKISDCLVSTLPFLVYASSDYPFVQYLRANECAHIATNRIELKEVLTRCLNDMNYRKRYGERAAIVSQQNHSLEAINNKFLDIVSSL